MNRAFMKGKSYSGKWKLLHKNGVLKTIDTSTKYQVLQKRKKISFILFQPLTGKKHQLRIISQFLKCPIIGDNKYSKIRYEKESLKLNAFYLKFYFENKKYEFKSNLTEEFQIFMKKNYFNLNFDIKKNMDFLSQIT